MYQVLVLALIVVQFIPNTTVIPGTEYQLIILVIIVCTHEICKNIRKLKEE